MTTVIEQQLQDLVRVTGSEGKLHELDVKRKQENIEAIDAELAAEREALATAQNGLGNAQAKLDKTRSSLERAKKKVDELESQLTLALSAKHRAGEKVSERKERIAELESGLAAWEAWEGDYGEA